VCSLVRTIVQNLLRCAEELHVDGDDGAHGGAGVALQRGVLHEDAPGGFDASLESVALDLFEVGEGRAAV